MQCKSIFLTEKSRYYPIFKYINDMNEDVTINRTCPHCNGNKIIKYGKVKSSKAQIFYCKVCKKRFAETIGTPFYRSRKDNEVWNQYFENMWTGYNIRECAKNIGVAENTSFSWRHKILSYYLKFFQRKTLKEEADIMVRTYVQNSKKEKESAVKNVDDEVCTLKLGEKFYYFFTINREGNIGFFPFDKYPLVRPTLQKKLEIVFNNISKLGVHGNNVIKSYAKKFVKEVTKVKAESDLFKYQRDMKRWISAFWGISFRYIANYFNWFRIYYINNKSYRNTQQYIYGTLKYQII